jgi:hypothetical protein
MDLKFLEIYILLWKLFHRDLTEALMQMTGIYKLMVFRRNQQTPLMVTYLLEFINTTQRLIDTRHNIPG